MSAPAHDPPMWNEHIGHWLAWLRAGGTRQDSVSLRRYQLQRFASDHSDRDPWSLTVDDLADWLADHEWSLETVRSHRSALRSFYGWGHATGRAMTDPSRLLRKVPATPPSPRPAPEQVIAPALARAGEREALMLMLGSRQGLRRGEISRVHSRDLVQDLAGWSLVVHGKGGKLRLVPLLDEVARALRALPPGWAFPGRSGHLTPAHVGRLLRVAMDNEATSHQLRHRFATRSYQGSGDIVAVSRLLGHASVATTQRYVATDDAALRRAVAGAA